MRILLPICPQKPPNMASSNIYIPTPGELDLMRQSGQISAQALKKALAAIKPGISLLEINQIAEDEMKRLGAGSSFKTVPGYFWTTCLTLNAEVVHGIPRDIILKEGDIISVDLGALYKGWHTDTAWSVRVGGGTTPFLQAGEKSMWSGIDQARAGNRIGDIGSAMQKVIESAGYQVVRSLVGHGVGRELHQDPEVPGYGTPGTGMLLKAGMTLAIEILYTESSREVVEAADGWTLVSSDNSLGGMFEMSVIVGEDSAEVLTDWRNI